MSSSFITVAYIERCTDCLKEQVERAGGWPVSFVFPEPENDDEREGLRLFIAELRKATGAAIRFTTEAGQA